MLRNILSKALDDLQTLVEQEDLDLDTYQEILANVEAKGESLVDASDRRIMLIRSCDGVIEQTHKALGALENHLKHLERVKEDISAATMRHLDANPQKEFRGTTGKLLARIDGGIATIKYLGRSTVEPKTIDRVVEKDWYPEEWVNKKEVYILKDKFEKEFRAGNIKHDKIEIAPRGRHVRIVP